MRRVVVLAVLTLAMALPIAAWADIITTNQGGTIAITGMFGTGGFGTVGVSTITSKGSELTQWNGTTGDLGRVNYATGTLASGSISGGGVFNAAGSSFDIIGTGTWASTLTGMHCGSGCALFTGSFSGPILWTLDSAGKQSSTYTLSGSLTGTLYNGIAITNAQTSQNVQISSKGQLNQGIGHITMGTTGIATPEPGTLGLLGTGLVAVAGMFRRKLIKG
jgi:hypothetical protein